MAALERKKHKITFETHDCNIFSLSEQKLIPVRYSRIDQAILLSQFRRKYGFDMYFNISMTHVKYTLLIPHFVYALPCVFPLV